MTTRLVSSQSYRDPETVARKRAARDYRVTVVTIETLGVAVVVDGHHSLSAAIADGVEPEIVECSDSDTLFGIDDVESWLARHWLGADYHNPITGELVW